MRNKAKKSFGQHFLIDELLTEGISQSLLLENEVKNVLEIGPGKGVLTKYLLKKDHINFKAVDADRDMIHYLFHEYPTQTEKFILQDCLKVRFDQLFDGEPFCVIGNFPYNISSQIVFKIIENKELVPEMVGMFQKEMANRIIAPHGSKTYGVISLLTQAYYSCDSLFEVPPRSFNPPPKVDSKVIRLTRKENALDCDPKLFKRIVKTTFSQRRKMLRNTLKSIIPDSEFLSDSFFTKRPEQLNLDEFINLTNTINQKIKQ